MPRAGVANFSPKALRRAMATHNITADELAQRAGVSASSVSTWLTATTNPSPPALARIASALMIEPGTLTPAAIGHEKLADLRAHAGLTQTAAAPALGIGATLLSVIERGGKGIYPQLVEPMASLYRVSRADVTAAWNRTTVTRRARR